MARSKKFHVAATLAAIAIVVAAAFAAGPALAAKGGNAAGGGKGGHGGGGSTSGSATLTFVGANPCLIPCTAKVHGTGFTPGVTVSVGMVGDYNWVWIVADSTGAFDYTYYATLYWPATYTIGANSFDGKSATVSFTVQ